MTAIATEGTTSKTTAAHSRCRTSPSGTTPPGRGSGTAATLGPTGRGGSPQRATSAGTQADAMDVSDTTGDTPPVRCATSRIATAARS